MSDEIKTGDIRISVDGDEIEVLAVNGEHFWGKWDSEDEPRTHRLTWAHDWTKPKPTFFEEKKNYRHSRSRHVYTVWHVLDMAKGKVAVVQNTQGDSFLITQGQWDAGFYSET